MNYKQAKYYIIKGIVNSLYRHTDSPTVRSVLANLTMSGSVVNVNLVKWQEKTEPCTRHSFVNMGVSIPCYEGHFLVEAEVKDKIFTIKIFEISSKTGLLAGLLDMYRENIPDWFIKLLRVNNEEHYIT